MLESARQHQVLMPVNFVLRYVPLVDQVKKIIDRNILGKPLRAYFENYATDHNLGPDHWFWDKKSGGGIFIEHGVHFFDLYRYWFGEAEILWSHVQKRQPSQLEDRVFCFMTHETGVLASHYHGFDQPAILDRQIHRILFEKGDVTVNGWIPQSASVLALVNPDDLRQLEEIFPEGDIQIQNSLPEQPIKGRGREIHVTQQVRMDYTSPVDKLNLYREAIVALLRDQILAIGNSSHHRIISEENGIKALELALQAAEKSENK